MTKQNSHLPRHHTELYTLVFTKRGGLVGKTWQLDLCLLGERPEDEQGMIGHGGAGINKVR